MIAAHIAFALAFAASAAAPGPEIAALVGRALTGGPAGMTRLLIGIVLGKWVMLGLALLGVSALVVAMGSWFAVLKYAGAAYLIWLGWRKWTGAGTTQITASTAGAGLADVGLGLALTLSNPIAILFYVALLPGVLPVGAEAWTLFPSLAAVIAAVMLAVATGYGFAAALARRALGQTVRNRLADRMSGAVFIGAGVLVATR